MKGKMRCAICGIRHETNTFSTLRTELENFRIQRGEEILQDGFFKSFKEVEWVPTLLASASPHGLVSREAYLKLKEELLERLSDKLPVDGIYMPLHGAMEVEEIGDGESDLVGSVRRIVGEDVPIVASLDLHGNIAPAFSQAANLLTAYRTTPHVDGVQTRIRAVKHLIRCVKEGIRPINLLVKIPLLLPGEYAITDVEPSRSLYARLQEVELEDGIMDASILIGCAWTDSPHASVSVIVVAEGEGEVQKARELAFGLAREIWSRRREFGPEVETLPVEEAIKEAMKAEKRPVVISDSGDNVTAGGAGDIPILLEKLLELGASEAVVAGITDPDAVARCVQAGEGSEITLKIGGKLDRINGYPIEVKGVVENLDPPSLALLKVNGVRIMLIPDRRPIVTRDDFDRAGVNPLEQQIITVKLGLLFSEIREIARRSIMALSPGFTDLRLDRLPYRYITRPVFPLNGDFEWDQDRG
ncbi:TPA: M81 family peptidase [Candidatus Poribacteria bacterium]|nr:M81 family peptidase [Candidatus Poribacteria bacterium]